MKSPSEFLASVCPHSALVSLPASQGSERRSPSATSHESTPSAPEDDSPVPSSSYGRFPPHPGCVSPLPAPSGSSHPRHLFHHSLVHRSPSKGSRVPAWSRRFRLTAAAPLLPTGTPGLATVVVASGIRVLLLRRPSVPSLAPFFGPSALRSTAITAASSLIRLLLTSLPLSPKRSPQVRCSFCPPVPSGST